MSEPPSSPSDLALILLLAGVYTLLRHRPAYVEVYSPCRPYAPLEPWLCATWRGSEEDIHAAAGFDRVIFVCIFVCRRRCFSNNRVDLPMCVVRYRLLG
jgi:calcium permeable stress-gated cation channel